jgi:two-component system sensor histidine kinase DesK
VVPVGTAAVTRTDPKRFDLYIRASLYLNFVAVPPLAGGALRPATLPWIVAEAVLGILLVRAGLTHYLGDGPRPVALIAAASVVAVLGSLTALLVYGREPANLALLVLAGSFVAALATAVRPAVALAVGAAFCAVSAALSGPAVVLAVVMLGAVVAFRVSAWTLGVVWELERSRRAQADLAVAEERLRFARDLHDVVGRTLSVVAIKAELAAQLARRGRPEAVEEMLAVRAVAQESLVDLRAVVGAYRAADLDAELAGARSLLASAGIACRVIGDASTVGPAAQAVLGWVVREGITNVLRHSEARTCVIALRTAADGTVTLTLDNDGAAPGPGAGAPVAGSGLTGLTERVAAAGGTVVASRRPPGGFRLVASLAAAP